MAAVTALAIGGLALAAIGTGVQFMGQRKAAKAQEDIAEQQKAQQELERRRSMRRVMRERRIARAQTLNVAGQTGAGTSSSVQGGLTSLSSQAGFEQGVLTASGAAADNIFSASRRVASGQQMASIGGGVASIGGSMFSAGGGFGAFKGKSAPTLQTTSGGLGFAGPRI